MGSHPEERMKTVGTPLTFWSRQYGGSVPDDDLAVQGSHSSLFMHRQLQQAKDLPYTQRQQQQGQLQSWRHSGFTAMQQLLHRTGAATADPGCLPTASEVLVSRPQATPPTLFSPTTEGPNILGSSDATEGGSSCSSSRTSSVSSASFPRIIESSSEAFSDSDVEEDGWMEVTLLAADLLPAAVPSHSCVPSTSRGNVSLLDAKKSTFEGDREDGAELGTSDCCRRERLEGATGCNFALQRTCRPSHNREQPHRETRGQPGFLLRGLAAAFRFRKDESIEQPPKTGHQQDHPQGAAAGQGAAAASAEGIVALQMELLQLSREARRQRGRKRETDADADAAASLSSSTNSSDSSNTSGTPRTRSSSNSSSLRLRPPRARLLSCGCPTSRYSCSAIEERQRSASAPTCTEGRLHVATFGKSEGLRTIRQWGGGETAVHDSFQMSRRRSLPSTTAHEVVGAQDCHTPMTRPACTAGASANAGGPVAACQSVVACKDREVMQTADAAAAKQRGRRQRELRAEDAVAVLQREKERQEFQQSVLWWFASDILMP